MSLPPRTAFRGPTGSSTEGPRGGVRMRLPPRATFRGPTGSSTQGLRSPPGIMQMAGGGGPRLHVWVLP
eukprot:9276835-Pyramimonas_sp.AAC.1